MVTTSSSKPDDQPVAPTPAAKADTAKAGFPGHKGRAGFDAPEPLAGGELLAAAQAKAPNLTKEFVDAYGLGEDVLAGIARGEISPPPTVGPNHSTDLYLTPGGWVSVPAGVPLEAAGSDAIAR